MVVNIVESLLARLDIAMDWLNQSIANVFEVSCDNPFEIELRLHVLEELLFDTLLEPAWHDSARDGNVTYSRWRSGKLRDWTPVAFLSGDVWRVPANERTAFVMVKRREVVSALTEYRSLRILKEPRSEMSISGLAEFFTSRAKSLSSMGRLNSLFGGLLSVESQVRLAETGLRAVFPEVYEAQYLHYSDTDYVFRLYCDGASEQLAAELFASAWENYIAETNLCNDAST